MCCSVATGRTGPAQCAAHHVACTVAGTSSPVCTYIRIYTPLDETLCSVTGPSNGGIYYTLMYVCYTKNHAL